MDERRARDHLSRDLDALEERLTGYAGLLKVQVCGPWTLAAGVELHRGDRSVADRGAVRDIAAALAEAVRQHAADLRRRVPGASIVVQLDEPSVDAIRSGRLTTASGFHPLREVADPEITEVLQGVLVGAGESAGVHCCAANPPLDLFRAAGAAFVSVDLTLLGPAYDDAFGECVQAGVHLLLGVVPTSPSADSVRDLQRPVAELWRRLSFPAERLAASVTLTPTCGLAGASPDWARAALTRCRDAARSLTEAPEG